MRRFGLTPGILLTSGLLALCSAGLAACGGNKLEEEDFVYTYTQQYCAVWLECSDPAMRVWDGLEGTEGCEAEIGPEMADKANGCKLVADNAQACLDKLADLACPADGQALDEALPIECEVAWKKCSLTAEDLEG